MKHTTEEILAYIHDNLGEVHRAVIQGTIYSEELMGGIVCREYGFLIPGKVNQGMTFMEMAKQARGDGGHGRHFWQIDDRSYPEFVNSTPQSDVVAYAKKAVECLEEKRKYLESKGWTENVLGDEDFLRAIVASYNCGQGNVNKALKAGADVDRYTFGGDYSKSVMEFAGVYRKLFTPSQAAAESGIDVEVKEPPEKATKETEEG
jgi:hypothetical protein